MRRRNYGLVMIRGVSTPELDDEMRIPDLWGRWEVVQLGRLLKRGFEQRCAWLLGNGVRSSGRDWELKEPCLSKGGLRKHVHHPTIF